MLEIQAAPRLHFFHAISLENGHTHNAEAGTELILNLFQLAHMRDQQHKIEG